MRATAATADGTARRAAVRRAARATVSTAVLAVLLLLAGCDAPAARPPQSPSPPSSARPPSGTGPAPSGTVPGPTPTPPTTTPTTPGAGGTRGGSADGGAARWQPRPGTSWQWQLTGPVDTGVDAAVYDVDGFDVGAGVVATLHAEGRKVVCYLNAGAYEDFRPDHGRYPSALLGADNGWPGERWLDIRQRALLAPLLSARLDMCRAKGFDAVEPDNVDGYTNDTGFPLTADDQLAFNRMVAGLAHARGLAVGLKNDLDQLPDLVGDFDFAVDEQCAEFHECDALTPFVAAGKAVFEAEYALPTSDFCADAARLRFSAILKHLSLDSWRETC
ncbi:endo alpha-1,4 polygalactosaminidase [Streptacidiphilus sp. EB129]|uniref:endo alpha-1,4 polygalactosaminidase n=1 Tax=Streptacidiphilus sp. EB129 TaxID=3156262 RepID=UPI0035154E76